MATAPYTVLTGPTGPTGPQGPPGSDNSVPGPPGDTGLPTIGPTGPVGTVASATYFYSNGLTTPLSNALEKLKLGIVYLESNDIAITDNQDITCPAGRYFIQCEIVTNASSTFEIKINVMNGTTEQFSCTWPLATTTQKSTNFCGFFRNNNSGNTVYLTLNTTDGVSLKINNLTFFRVNSNSI
jgi:hypothetical protein